MADITRNSLYNQKRRARVAVAAVTEAEILAVAGVVNLPPRSLVTAVRAIVTTASATAGANVSLLAGVTPLATNLAVTVAGVITEAVVPPTYLPLGGLVTIVGGAVPPATGLLVSEYVIEYIELDVTTGEYTV